MPAWTQHEKKSTTGIITTSAITIDQVTGRSMSTLYIPRNGTYKLSKFVEQRALQHNESCLDQHQ